MENQITYLFGAGASKNALPIVNEIPVRIGKLIEFLELPEHMLSENESYDNLGIPGLSSKREHQLEMIDSLKWMLEESSSHASIDTFAKKLFITRKFDELDKLKIAMSIFLLSSKPEINQIIGMMHFMHPLLINIRTFQLMLEYSLGIMIINLNCHMLNTQVKGILLIIRDG